MKKLVVMAISMLLVCGVANIARADLVTTNLLVNPGFETFSANPPVNFTGWTEGFTTVDSIQLVSSAAVVHNGLHSAYISQDGGYLYQDITLPGSGNTILYGAYFRVQTFNLVSNWDQVQVTLSINGPDGTVGGSVSNLSKILNNSSLWTNTGTSSPNYWTDWILLSGTIDITGLNSTPAGFNISLQNGSTTIRSNFFVDDAFAGAPVPEPGTMMLLGSGLVGLAGYGRRRFKK